MRAMLQKAALGAVGTTAAIALVGGLSVTIVQPLQATECQYDGINFLGQQPGEGACFLACYSVHGESLDDVNWSAWTGCCRCLY